ncbi:LysR family transcriptional regulator [Bacillus sp. DTU_2020_1000418_1_SI_GHA_SEK_038]|uniref:LysR family transcriptional regulator n=1 Tax=Bacillus sp. DTU_2020_1000418_1_SI_GHA_SEK_038 TaxID=3077585 RepID=UPI0028E5EBF9|nr:LysR family transcriptional regulator [Bacillus sp. DTU_2020_1000418_1_SI_GHA_SEK_038]WNS75361.1 LysR family transcriptional regulator [Bacillus sp. DTU_2020_1000418_1_SI_GHA_SEK_038]
MDHLDWHLLTTLFEYKNITKTSEVLRSSQPAITYRLQRIEDEFGVKIVYRGHRGVSFTPQGEYLAEYAAQMLKELRKAKEEVLNFENNIQGILRISASSIFSRYKLPPILGRFSEKYPLVEFHVDTGWSEEVINAIFKDQSHLGILRGNYNFSHEKQLLMEENLLLVSKTPIDLKKLSKLPRIYYNTDTSLKTLIDNWWTENYVSPPTITMRVDNMETCKEMVLNGLGYAILPNILLEGDEKLYKTPCLTKDGQHVKRKTWLIYKKEYSNNVLVKAFCDFLKDWDFKLGSS